MSQNIRIMAFAGAVLLMGMTMPSCPGQQAMQQQIDTVQSANDMNSKRVQAMDIQLRQMGQDFSQSKQLLEQMANAIQTQKASIDQLNASLKMMDAKVNQLAAQKSRAPTKTASKKKH